MISRRALMFTASATPFLSLAGPGMADTPKDTLVLGMAIDDIISLDPAQAFEFSGGEVDGNCYERLVIPNPKNPSELVGEIAEKWTISPDGLTFTFTLKSSMKFASGKPITAEDAAFSLQRAVKLNKTPAFIINQFGFTKDNVDERIKATGPLTLTYTIGESIAPSFVLYCLSANVGSVVEKAVVMSHDVNGDMGNEWMKSNSAGSGPFVVRSWKASESVILDANPNSPLKPKIRRAIMKHIPDPSAQMLQLKQGDIDIARNLLPDQLKSAMADKTLQTSTAPRSYVMYTCMNQNHPMLSKPQVRQAIKWAIDYEGIHANIVSTTHVVQESFIPQGVLGSINDRPFKKDIAKAKALMAEAGLAGGFEITLDHSNVQPVPDIAQTIQANLAEIGIKATLVAGEGRQVITKYRARQHQLLIQAWGIDYFDPHSNAETFCVNVDNSDGARSKTLAWRNSWQDADLTQRALAAVKETDTKKRAEMYAQMQRDHHQRGPFALMFQSVEIAVMRKNLANFAVAPMYSRTRFDTATKT